MKTTHFTSQALLLPLKTVRTVKCFSYVISCPQLPDVRTCLLLFFGTMVQNYNFSSRSLHMMFHILDSLLATFRTWFAYHFFRKILEQPLLHPHWPPLLSPILSCFALYVMYDGLGIMSHLKLLFKISDLRRARHCFILYYSIL